MAYNPLPFTIGRNTLVSVTFKPEDSSGLLIYSDRNATGTSVDFLALGLYNGFVEFRYNLGSGTAIIRSSKLITLNEWHSVTAVRTDRAGTVQFMVIYSVYCIRDHCNL